MQLRTARLCLDCEEIHDRQRCPVCASETFTYITRWIPAPERRTRTRAQTSEVATALRRVSAEQPPSRRGARVLNRAAVGLTAIGIIGWLWGRRAKERPKEPEA